MVVIMSTEEGAVALWMRGKSDLLSAVSTRLCQTLLW